MKLIDLIAAGTIAFLFTALFCKLWLGIAETHADALRTLKAVNDASILVSAFREGTADKTLPMDFPVRLSATVRGISGIRQTVTTDAHGKRGYTLIFSLLGKECTVCTEAGE